MLATLSWLKTLVSRHEAVTSGGGRVEAVFFSPEQFLNTLQADILVWIQERKPTITAEAGRLAEDHWQARTLWREWKESGWRMGGV